MDDRDFFYTLMPEKILDAVESYGFRCTGRALALNSMENRVYELEIEPSTRQPEHGDPSFIVAKFYRPGRWTREQILEEHSFLRELSAQDLAVVAPLKTEGGDTLCELPEAHIFFALFPKFRGRVEQEYNEEQLQRLGRLLARLHIIGSPKQSNHRLHLSPETYGLANLEILKESKLIPNDFEASYFQLAKSLVEFMTPMFQGISVQRVHGDCHLGNVIWNKDGPTLVDFDDMLVGPPVQDLWLLIPGRDEESSRQLEVLLRAYEQLRTFDRSTLRLIEPLRTLRLIHYCAWIAKRWEDPSFQRTFPQFTSREYWREQLGYLAEQRDVMCF